jgi:hypothetical protein
MILKLGEFRWYENLPEDMQDRRSRLSWRPVGQPHEVFAEFSVNLKVRAMLSFQLMKLKSIVIKGTASRD